MASSPYDLAIQSAVTLTINAAILPEDLLARLGIMMMVNHVAQYVQAIHVVTLWPLQEAEKLVPYNLNYMEESSAPPFKCAENVYLYGQENGLRMVRVAGTWRACASRKYEGGSPERLIFIGGRQEGEAVGDVLFPTPSDNMEWFRRFFIGIREAVRRQSRAALPSDCGSEGSWDDPYDGLGSCFEDDGHEAGPEL